MSITHTVGDGYFIHFEREGIVMRCRKKTKPEAECCLKMMKEDSIVDLRSVRYYFQKNRILILRKPCMTDPTFRQPYLDKRIL
jgi:hypothetical protein